MKDINTTTQSGRLTRDAELRQTSGGFSICTFSIACNSSEKKDDEWIDYPNYLDCTLFGKIAEALADKLKKGVQVFISGELHQDRWEDKDGGKRSKVGIRIQNIRVITTKKSDESPVESIPAPVASDEGIPF